MRLSLAAVASLKALSTRTSYLVAGPGGGSKLARARRLNVPVIDEDAFISLLQGDSEQIPPPNPTSIDDAVIELDTIAVNNRGVNACSRCDSVELVEFENEYRENSIWICEGLHARDARHALYGMGYEPVAQSYSGRVHRVARDCGRDESATTMLEEDVTCAACLGIIEGAVHLADQDFEPSCNVAHIHQVRLTRQLSRLTCPSCRAVGVKL